MSDDIKIQFNRDLLRWVLLAVGIIALITAGIAELITPGPRITDVALVGIGLGIIGVGGFILIDPEALAAAFTARAGQYRTTSMLMTIGFAAFVVVLFILVRSLEPEPIDLTEAQRYKLQEESLTIIENFDEPVHAYAFFTPGARTREDAEIWLQNYRNASDGLITYEFIDPDRNPTVAQEYEVTRPGVIVFEQGDRTATANQANERALTQALSQVQVGRERTIYVTTGHGERSMETFQEQGLSSVNNQLSSASFTTQAINLLQEGGVPDDADLLLIPGPSAQFSQQEVDYIASYLEDGGAVFLLSDPGTGGGNLGLGVLAVDVSADGQRIVTAGADGVVRVWDLEAGEELAVMRGHASDVLDAAFSPDGSQVATASTDGTARLWDADSGEELAILEGQTDVVSRIAFSPDGSYIASVGEDPAVNVWDAETLQPLSYSPLAVSTPLRALAFSPDSDLLAAAGGREDASNPVLVWDITTGDTVAEERMHTTAIFDVVFTSEGDIVYSVALDGTRGVLDIETGESNTSPLFEQGISGLAISPDGTHAYALANGTVHLRGADADEDGVVIDSFEDIVWDLTFTPDGETLATASRDGQISLWNVEDGEEVRTWRGHAASDPLLTYLEEDWGVTVHDDLVVDILTAQQFNQFTPVAIDISSNSPVTSSLVESGRPVFLPITRSLEVAGDEQSAVTHTVLLRSSSQGNQMTSWGETSNLFGGGSAEFDEADLPGPVALAAQATNPQTGARLVVVGDVDFASNSATQQANFGNAEFFINAANWLAEGEDAVQLPPPNFEQRTLQPFQTPVLWIIMISVTCIVPLLVLLGGGAVWLLRRRRR